LAVSLRFPWTFVQAVCPMAAQFALMASKANPSELSHGSGEG
jgi:hypothetical protein